MKIVLAIFLNVACIGFSYALESSSAAASRQQRLLQRATEKARKERQLELEKARQKKERRLSGDQDQEKEERK